MLEDLTDTLASLCGALDITVGSNALAHLLTLFDLLEDGERGEGLTCLLGGYGLLAGLVELLNGLGVEAKILLAANENDGESRAEVKHLGDPLQRVNRLGTLCKT